MWTIVLLTVAGWLGACGGALDDWNNFHIIWQDEFDTLDKTKWTYSKTASGGDIGSWPVNSFQVMTDDPVNSFVQDGVLHIKPTLLETNINPITGKPYGPEFLTNGVLDIAAAYGDCTDNQNSGCLRRGADGNIPPVMSANLQTIDTFSFTYGRVALRVKLAAGDWLWPIIWMLPADKKYGEWPRSGEIDIISAKGNQDYRTPTGKIIGIQRISSDIYWGPNADELRLNLSSAARVNTSSSYGDVFHDYVLDWSPNGLQIFVDDMDTPLLSVPDPALVDQNSDFNFWEFGKPWNPDTVNPWESGTNLAPFDIPFYFIVEVTVGSQDGFFPDDGVNRGEEKPWSNDDPHDVAMKKFYDSRDSWLWTWADNSDLQVDYIRVYKRNEA